MAVPKIFKNILRLGVTLLVFSILLSAPAAWKNSQALAQGAGAETPYGGLNLFQIDCTCTGNTIIYINDAASSGVLGLIYQEGSSKLFSNNNIFGEYLLGSYMKNSGQCEIEVGPDCVQLNSDGEMGSAPGTGTSDLWNLPIQIAQAFTSPDYGIKKSSALQK